jgi:hypothetical protein
VYERSCTTSHTQVDASAAADVRANIQSRLGEPAADALVPVQPAEEQARTRAALLLGTVVRGGR